MNFDVRGNLIETIEMDFSQFQEVFVEKWEKENSIRHAIFKDFETYIADFKTLITPDFDIWVDGSFLCNKRDNPKDIDFVSFIDCKIFEAHSKLIESRFGKNRDKTIYYSLLDAYIFQYFPATHENAFFSVSDKAYWADLFSNTKPDRLKQKYKKGFVKLKIY